MLARLTNVFVAPGEVFEEVKAGPPTPANWIAPLVIAVVAGIIYSMVVFSQPAIIQKLKEQTEKPYQAQVAAGKMTQKAADEITDKIESVMTPTLMKTIGILGALLGNPVGLFLTALVMWLLGRYLFKGRLDYMQAVEVTGLAMMISALGVLIQMLLAVIYGNTSVTPGPVLLVQHFDPANKIHVLLATLNLVAIWHLAVLSIGLARLSGTSVLKAALWFYGLWACLVGGPIGLMILLGRLK